jgi:YD repeat-containing protein
LALSVALIIAVSTGAAYATPETNYMYDALGRILLVTYPDNSQDGFAYDSAGNRVKTVHSNLPASSAAGYLYAGQAIDRNRYIQSPSGRYSLVVQTDGNLVIYGQSGGLWGAPNAFGQPSARLVMQTDGNLVLYDPTNTAIWMSNTGGNPGAQLVMQDDGNLVIYNTSGVSVWASGTYCGLC